MVLEGEVVVMVLVMVVLTVLLAQTSIGQVSRVDVSSKVEVVWADNSMTVVLPQVRKSTRNEPITSSVWLLLMLCSCTSQHLYGVESEMEETDYDSVEETSSVLSTEEWEDESDSWETDNGLTTEDDCHVNSADGTDAATPHPTPTPTSSTVYIIPLQEDKAGISGPSRGGSGEDWDLAATSPAGAGDES